MTYFSNGTQGAGWEADNCRRCVHDSDEKPCAVLILHHLWNPDACNGDSNRARCPACKGVKISHMWTNSTNPADPADFMYDGDDAVAFGGWICDDCGHAEPDDSGVEVEVLPPDPVAAAKHTALEVLIPSKGEKAFECSMFHAKPTKENR